jgi:hypothetical protein
VDSVVLEVEREERGSGWIELVHAEGAPETTTGRLIISPMGEI